MVDSESTDSDTEEPKAFPNALF